MTYRYDVFLSYPRDGNGGDWVRNHFKKALRDFLNDELPEQPEIFFDEAQPIGVHWPQNMQDALLRSRVLVAVWSPPYFRSAWCLAEWKSMRAREQRVRTQSAQNFFGLVYPVVFWDGQNFPPEARDTQWLDLSDWALPSPEFERTAAFVGFQKRMREVARGIAHLLAHAPPWQEDWPVLTPPTEPPPAFPLPRL